MKLINSDLDIFKKNLKIVTKTISKQKKIEINYVNNNSSIKGNIINIQEPPENLSIKNITICWAKLTRFVNRICYLLTDFV